MTEISDLRRVVSNIFL